MLCGLRPLLDYHQEWQARLQDRPRGHFHYLCAHRRADRRADGRADGNTCAAAATAATAIAAGVRLVHCRRRLDVGLLNVQRRGRPPVRR